MSHRFYVQSDTTCKHHNKKSLDLQVAPEIGSYIKYIIRSDIIHCLGQGSVQLLSFSQLNTMNWSQGIPHVELTDIILSTHSENPVAEMISAHLLVKFRQSSALLVVFLQSLRHIRKNVTINMKYCYLYVLVSTRAFRKQWCSYFCYLLSICKLILSLTYCLS